jgi:hypothetical protein
MLYQGYQNGALGTVEHQILFAHFFTYIVIPSNVFNNS